ncbi:hypothetical protein HPB51_013886 [Rhipicephalus microplus]|uniref:Uncharacterized protein n=1 Tax=Rhipicephalus microplus TaxID=6941 RepID=A0A9J6EH47_RHIMP|nr:hypothetical protein HPB51_013886 [Rhipicephalus microplus]
MCNIETLSPLGFGLVAKEARGRKWVACTGVLTCALSLASLWKAVMGPSGSLASSCSALDTWPLAAGACGPASPPTFRARQRSPLLSVVRASAANFGTCAHSRRSRLQALRSLSQREDTAGCPVPSLEAHSANFLEITLLALTGNPNLRLGTVVPRHFGHRRRKEEKEEKKKKTLPE